MPDLHAPLPAHGTIRGIGGSDIQRIRKGDWHSLWLEKTGRQPPEDLTWKLPVQIGRALEPVILDFYAHEQDATLYTGPQMLDLMPGRDGFAMPDGRFTIRHRLLPWAIASFDALRWRPSDGVRPVEAKTTNYWNATKQTPAFIQSYASQCQWYMEIGYFPCLDFVFPVDNQRIEAHTIAFDECYASLLLAEAEEFWDHVIRDREPAKGRAPLKTPKPQVVLSRTYDMAKEKEANAWADAAGRWANNRWAAAAYQQAAQDIKALIPEDARTAAGFGITATRDKAGRVSITADDEKE